MLQQSSSRNILENQMGPILKNDINPFKCYEKDRSPSRISIESELQNKMKKDEGIKMSIQNVAAKKKNIKSNISREKHTNFQKNIPKHTIQLIQKFKNVLLMKSYILSQHNKWILNEESYLQPKIDKTQYKNKNQKSTNNLLTPGCQLVEVWDMSAIFFYCFSLWLCPFVQSFVKDDSYSEVEMLLIIHIILDIIISLNRPIIIQGEIIFDKNEIRQNYYKRKLLEDLIYLTIWFFMYFNFNQIPVMNEIIAIILLTITILKVKRSYENFIESLSIQGAINQLVDLITLIVMIYFFSHIMACIFHHVGDITSDTENCWLIHYNLLDKSISVKYNHSFYWATMTMVTIGYGNITPQNEAELAIVNLLMLLSIFMFGYSMISIGMIMKNIQDTKYKCKQSLIIMNSYMKQCQVDPQIQSRVRNFIKYKSEMKQKENNEDYNQIINDLPNQLKEELQTNVQMNKMKKIKIIKMQFTQKTCSEVSQNLIQLKFTPGDFIYHQDQLNNSLYYIKNGQIQLIEERSEKVLQIFKSSSTFGEYQFFTDFPPKTTAQSIGYTEVYQIKREIFLKIIKSCHKDFERFHNIKDNLILYSNYQVILQQCNFCKMYTHSNIDCPLFNYKSDAHVLSIREERKYPFQKRKSLCRIGNKIKSLLILQLMDNHVQDYLKKQSSIQNVSEISPNTYQQQQIQIQDNPIGSHIQPFASTTTYARPLPLTMKGGKSGKYVFNQASQTKNYFLMQNYYSPIAQEQSFIKQLYFDYQFHYSDIDQMQEYQIYMPQNNFSNYIQQRKRFLANKHEIYLLSKSYIAVGHKNQISFQIPQPSY